MEEIEIWQTALALTEADKAKAVALAYGQAHHFLSRGNLPAARNWARIAWASNALQRLSPDGGETIH